VTHDLVLVGGGLANGLLAAQLRAARPELDFMLLERGPVLGGNHTWSFHATDVSASALALLEGLGARRFEGYDVRFEGVQRTLSGAYCSLRSEDFDRALRPRLEGRLMLGAAAREVTARHVVLDDGRRLEARAVIDARAAPAPMDCGYQKFLGQDVELDAPHGLERPLLIDATVEQLDGFRFVYVLPWSATRLLVEDTLYSGTPDLDLEAARGRIAAWLSRRGLRASRVLREEHGALPLPLRGAAPSCERPRLGLSAGLFHATTGYSLPFAARLAERLAAKLPLDAPALTQWVNGEVERHWRSQRFFRLLNRMLFLAAAPGERVRIFEAFYGHGEALISRFYAGQLRFSDIVQCLRRGAPTVGALSALRAAAAG